MSLREDTTSVKGRVSAAVENGLFEVKLDDGKIMQCGLDKAMKRWSVVIAPDDIVTVEFPDEFPERARIVFRHLHK